MSKTKSYKYKYKKKKASELKKIKEDVKMLKKSVEKKFTDTAGASQTLSPTGILIQPLSSIAQGTTDVERIGDRIFATSMHIKATLSTVASSNISPKVRMIAYIDKTNSLDNLSDVLLLPTAQQNYVNAFYNQDERKNFTILEDKIFQLNKNGSALVAVRNIDYFKALKKTIAFNAGTTTINSNDIKIRFISDVLVQADEPSVDFVIRTRYTDS